MPRYAPLFGDAEIVPSSMASSLKMHAQRSPKMTKNCAKIHENSLQNQSQSVRGGPERLRVALGQSGDGLGRSRDAVGTLRTRPGRSKNAPGRPRGAPKSPGDAPGTVPRRARSIPESSLSSFASPNALRNPCGSIFDGFSIDAWKLRSAFPIGFCRVF